MNVALVGARRPGQTGHDPLVAALAASLGHAGHTVHVVGAAGAAADGPGITAHPVRAFGPSAWAAIREAWEIRRVTARVIATGRIDAIVAVESGLSTLLLAWMRRDAPLMLVLPHHGVDAEGGVLPGYWRRQVLRRWITARVSGLAACTALSARGAEEAYHTPVRRLALQSVVCPITDSDDAAEPAPEYPLIVCTGPWTGERARWIGRALRIAISYMPHLRVMLLPELNAPAVDDSVVQEINVPAWTTVIRPSAIATPAERLLRFESAAVVVVPGTDVCGQPAVDAMAAGRPVISTLQSPIADVIEHGRDGWLVESGDGEALGEALVVLLGYGALRHQISRYAREKIGRLGDRHAAALRCAAVIEQMVTAARLGDAA